MARQFCGDVFLPPLGSRVRCIDQIDGTVWTDGKICKDIIVPRVGVVYVVRDNILSLGFDPVPFLRGLRLQEIKNELIELRKGTRVEPYFPYHSFVMVGRSP